MAADLESVEKRLEELAPLKAEWEELEIAARVLRRLAGSNGKTPKKPSKITPSPQAGDVTDLKDITISQAATKILGEHPGEEMHFSYVADEAMKRGYKGRAGSEAKSIRQSFWATMKRAPDKFKSAGEGKFSLKA